MKKSSIFSVISVAILAIFINLFSINLANAAAQDIFVAYVSAKDDDEFVFLYNSGEDFRVDSLNLVKITTTKETKIPTLMSGIFRSESFLKIPISNKQIPNNPKFNLEINGQTFDGFCATSVGDCGISNLKDGDILVNNRLPGGDKFSTISREDFSNLNLIFQKSLDEPQAPSVENPTDTEQTPLENPQPPAENTGNPEAPETPTLPKDDCRNFRITEILANSGEQFIEIENFSNEISNLKGCVLRSSASSSKDHAFDDQEIEPMKFFVLKISESSLKLNKTTKGEISFFDSENSQIQSVKFEPLKAESSWAFFEEGWKQTFEITPNEENVFLPCEAGYERDSNTSRCVKIKLPEEEKKCAEGYFLNPESGRCKKLEEPKVQAECAAGYFRNPETGRCKKVEVEDLPTPCASGYYRSPETGRCRKIATLASATLTPCKEGYYRHPETNRCRKIASETEELTPCKEGYERNPETNRCRKIVKNLAAEEKVETSDEPKKSEFTGWWAVFGVIFVLILVALWEFRKSILAFFKKGKK